MIIKAIKRQILLSKGGKPYTRVLLQFDEYLDGKGNLRWVSGFGNKRTWLWKIGEDVQPKIEEKDSYLNFSFEDTDENRLDVYSLPATVGFVLELLKGKPAPREEDNSRNSEPEQIGNDEIYPEDIPF